MFLPSALFLASISLLAHLTTSQAQQLLPLPSGRDYNVTISHLHFHSPSSPDPYHPDPTAGRHVMISVFYPLRKNICSGRCYPAYMPNATAVVSGAQFFGSQQNDSRIFENIKFQACCGVKQGNMTNPTAYPVVVIEPNVGTTRFLYGAIAQEIASQGYVVVTVDHPYDSSIVELDPGSGSENSTALKKVELDPFVAMNPWNATVTKAFNTRLSDLEIVTTSLRNYTILQSAGLNTTLIPIPQNAAFNTLPANTNIIGHGLGGSISTYLSTLPSTPSPYLAANSSVYINLAGTPPLIPSDTYAPILFFGLSPGFRREDSPHWNASWPHFRGDATEWDLFPGQIYDYSDLPLILNITSSEYPGARDMVRGVGPVGGKVGMKVAWEVTTKWVWAYLGLSWEWKGRASVERRLNEFVGEYQGVMRTYPRV
ncbi:uncharacterized protein BDR25DRAFT_237332 [Lindgomyces ingoldianus]|uniref:Uncharacterized protein n=1 Tax=Lindgomyces ingoldianus TaxID=673940 RepID=A0ACB6QIU3_9PLEO|nr:uncharacterized protein BDR25DRAFT_237332 [Lindgomyces ingoldianus]KAF2466242.1 hypothetical protein BDR25DRAFT_237332 [Lindgomyces ingoldianus]